MSLLKYIVIGIAVLIALLFAGSFFLPSGITIKRSITIEAENKEVYYYLNDLKQWSLWSPWLADTTENEIEYSKNTLGKNAYFTWRDIKKKETGKLTILHVAKNKSLHYKVEYADYHTGYGTVYLQNTGKATFIVWKFESDMKRNPLNKYAALFIEQWAGHDFENALQNLKRVCEN
jgi:hypothetical protein